jgi:hypothetical protein
MKLEDFTKKKQPKTIKGQSNKFYTGDGRKNPLKSLVKKKRVKSLMI